MGTVFSRPPAWAASADCGAGRDAGGPRAALGAGPGPVARLRRRGGGTSTPAATRGQRPPETRDGARGPARAPGRESRAGGPRRGGVNLAAAPWTAEVETSTSTTLGKIS
jgi:hypothetical protein